MGEVATGVTYHAGSPELIVQAAVYMSVHPEVRRELGDEALQIGRISGGQQSVLVVPRNAE